MSLLCVCRISGKIWSVESPAQLTIRTRHPLFDLSQGQLVTMWEQSGIARRLDADTLKLLSLALLLKTELVLVGSSSVNWAEYPLSVALKSIPPLITVLGAVESAPLLREELPKFRVAHYVGLDIMPPELSNLPDVLNTWIEGISEQRLSYRSQQRASMERIDALTRLINCGTKPIKAAKHLALYAAHATGFPSRKVGTSKGIISQRDYWVELITLCARITNNEGFNVLLYGTEMEDLQAVLEWLQDNSGKGDVFIYQATALIKRGIASYGDIFAPIMLTSSTISREGQTIAAAISGSVAANMPMTKPDKAAYASKVEYFKALSAWNLSKGQRGKQHD